MKAIDNFTLTEVDITALIDFSSNICPIPEDILEEVINKNLDSLIVMSHYLLHNLINERNIDDDIIERIIELLREENFEEKIDP